MRGSRHIPLWPVALLCSVVVNTGGIATLGALGDSALGGATRSHRGETSLVIELPPAPPPPAEASKPEAEAPTAPNPEPDPKPEPPPFERETRLGAQDSMAPDAPAWIGSTRATAPNQAPRHEVDQAPRARAPMGDPSPDAGDSSPAAPMDQPSPEASRPDAADPSKTDGGAKDQGGESREPVMRLDLGAEARERSDDQPEPARSVEVRPASGEFAPSVAMETEGLAAYLQKLARTLPKREGDANRAASSPAAPSAGTKTGGPAARPAGRAPGSHSGGGSETAGEPSDSEADAASKDAVVVDVNRVGQVQAGRGLQVSTVKPRYGISSRIMTFPDNPIVRVVFGRDGKVRRAVFLRGTGEPSIDGPLLDAIHRWTATGEELGTIPAGDPQAGLSITFRIVLR